MAHLDTTVIGLDARVVSLSPLDRELIKWPVFVGQTFVGLSVPGYEPADMLAEEDPHAAREVPGEAEGESQVLVNSQQEKRGRTKKERKNNAGRKTKSGVVREPMQLSLDVRTIKTLGAMGVNKSQLFEELLQQYEPFVKMWSSVIESEEEQL